MSLGARRTRPGTALTWLAPRDEFRRCSTHCAPERCTSPGYARENGRCTFVDARGHRCKETGLLEFDHLDGFARTRSHDPERIVLRCRGHNQHEAEKMYGPEFGGGARAKRSPPPAAVDAPCQEPLFAPPGPELHGVS